MIYYDSHRWTTLFKIHGSVLPKAMGWAIPSAFLAFALKWLEQDGFVELDGLSVLTQGNIYSGFTYVLGFSLVFRTSKAYARYWTACTSVHEMASEWSDSCASLIAFISISSKDESEVSRFKHTLVRLFSLLHAMALSEIAESDMEMPLLDVDGLSKSQLALLASPEAQGKTVQICLGWIKAYITQAASKGLLNVPPPLLSHVFREMGTGLVSFHSAQQVGIWPFPFPYTQLTVLLIHVYTIITPLVICTWKTVPVICTIFCFFSVTCMVGLDLIANELEDPFGDDPNDLPLVELQGDMNKFLLVQLHPQITNPPELLSTAIMDHAGLSNLSSSSASASKLDLKTFSRSYTMSGAMTRRDKLQRQMKWAKREEGTTRHHDMNRLRELLKVKNTASTFFPHGLGTDHRVASADDFMASLEANLATVAEGGTGALNSVVEDPVQENQLPTPAADPAPVVVEIEPKLKPDESAGGKAVVPGEAKPGEPAAVAEAKAAEGAEALVAAVAEGKAGEAGGSYCSTSQWNKFLDALHVELQEHLESRIDVQRRELGAVEALLQHFGKDNAGECAEKPTESRDSSAPGQPLPLKEGRREQALPAALRAVFPQKYFPIGGGQSPPHSVL